MPDIKGGFIEYGNWRPEGGSFDGMRSFLNAYGAFTTSGFSGGNKGGTVDFQASRYSRTYVDGLKQVLTDSYSIEYWIKYKNS